MELKNNISKIKIVDFSIKYKTIIIISWVFVLISSLFLITNLLLSNTSTIDNSVGIWFMKDDPELITYENFNKEFGEKEWSVLLLETDTVFNAPFLRDLCKITNRIEKIKHIKKVFSLTNVRDSKLRTDSMLEYSQLYPVSDSNQIITKNQLNEFKNKIAENPIYENSIIHKNDIKRTVILFQNDNFIHELKPYRIEMIDSLKSILKDFALVKNYSLAGTSIVNAEFNRSSKRDAQVFYILVSLFIIISGYLLLKNIKDLFVLLVVVAFSAIPPMALLIIFNIPFNLVTVMLPPVLISLSVCDVTHVINAFHYERRFLESKEAINVAISKIWNPCIWTSVITIIGFLSLAFSSVFPIWQLGVFGAIGIFLAWLITMPLAPIILISFWPKKIASTSILNDGSKKVGLYSKKLLPFIARYRWLWIVVFFILLYPLFGISNLKVDTNYTKFFGSKMDVTLSYNEIKKNGFGQNPVSIVLKYPKEKTLYSENYFPLLLKFEEALKKDTSIMKLLSVTDLVDRIDIAFNGNYQGKPRITEYSENKLAQLFLLGEMSNNTDIENFTNELKNQVQIIAMTSYMSSKELSKFKNRIYELGKIIPKEVQISISGTTVLWANMDKQISSTQINSVLIIMLIFVFILPFIFKSLKLGIVGVLINCLPLAITFGMMGLLDIKINIATALIGGISIGSTIDSTIFFINRFKLGLKEGLSWNNSVGYAIVTVGDGMIMTSLILAGGFFCMSVSNFLPTAHLGIFITFSILVSLFLDIIINPIVIRLLNPEKTKDKL